jgi:hypothetical protein
METTAIIKHEGGKWKLYSHAGKLLGTHDTKEDAVKQEQAIQINKAKGSIDPLIVALDEVATELDNRGSPLANEVDSLTVLFTEALDEQLDKAGFDSIVKRNPDVADDIAEDRIVPLDMTKLYSN